MDLKQLDKLRKTETSELFTQLTQALTEGRFADSFNLADEMCRPERAGTCKDLIAPVKNWKGFEKVDPSLYQGIQDRIDQYNNYASRS